MQALAPRLRIDDGGQVAQQVGKFKRLVRDEEFAAFDLGHVQHVVDQHEQMARRNRDFSQTVFQPPAVVESRGRNGGHADDGVHGRADFVAHAREKFTFGPVGTLRVEQSVAQDLLRFAHLRHVRERNDIARHHAALPHGVDADLHPDFFPRHGVDEAAFLFGGSLEHLAGEEALENLGRIRSTLRKEDARLLFNL